MRIFFLITTIFLFGYSNVIGQEKEEVLQVITKRITKSFPYSEGFEVNLEGENAEVLVESWEKQEIFIQIELVAKHPEKETAKGDLEQMVYLLERVKRKIYARNYISGKEEVKTEAMMEARYTIKLPEECPIYIKNQFGETDVRNLASQLRIFNEFGKISLNNIRGDINMRTRFGDVSAYQLAGNFDIYSRRSNLDLHNIVGNYNIESHYGSINLWAGEGLIDLNINAQKADVNLFNIDPLTHQQQLVVQQGNIRLPDGWQYNFEEDTPQIKKVTFKPDSEYYATFTINISFGDLKIEKKAKP
ncbi:MAG: hypothetical protein AAFO82_09735 [Bacteroidota bacterium]